jgi:hypothetical protein
MPVAWEYKPVSDKIAARDVWTAEPFVAAIVQLGPRAPKSLLPAATVLRMRS